MKIASVCHDPAVNLALEGFAATSRHEYVAFASSGAALSALQSCSADLIVLEMGREDPQWLDFIEAQKQENSSCSIVFIGDGSDGQISRAQELGAEGYLTCPVNPKLLSLTISPLLRKSYLQSGVSSMRAETALVTEELRSSLKRQKDAVEEQDLTYRELLLAYSRLQDLNEQKNKFLASATHELRTPVTVIKGYHRILLDGRLGELAPEQKEVLQESEQSCARLIKIINSLLELSRIESGTFELFYQEYDPATNIKQIVNQLKEPFQRKKISVTIDIPQDLPRCRCDREKVNQVITHLLENTIKYTQPGGKVHVAISLCVWDRKALPSSDEADIAPVNQPPNSIIIEVSDNGIGISPEHQQEIFEQFAQVPSNQMNRSGLGLGLTISKQVIEAHGGRIWVESALNSGSRFSFVLPLEPAQSR